MAILANILLMKTFRQLFSLLTLTFCSTAFSQTPQSLKPGSTKTVSSYKQKDTTCWVDNFRQFRDALYRNDKSKAKEFLDFPFKNEGNEIWYLAYSGDEKATDSLDQNVKPFTEKDFDKYFNKIFTKPLIKCLLKIKTNELYNTGKSESPEIKDSSTTYKLYATFDKANRTVELNLATKTRYKISGTEYEEGESNFIYRFMILKNEHIKLKRILIAG